MVLVDDARRFFYNACLDKGGSGGAWPGKVEPAEIAKANLVGSLCDDEQHRPVIDLDVPARLLESSTPGHSHLYIDVPMTWELYVELLTVLVKAGVVEQSYVDHSIERGMTLVRVPWVRKVKP